MSAEVRLVVFDFDGTLSWLRHGWPGMMFDVFEPHFPSAARENGDALRSRLLDEILALNGSPSIRQCERVAQILREEGGPALDPETCRAEFQRRLDDAIERRSERIRSGSVSPDAYVVVGGRALLEELDRRGHKLSIVSSTIETRVRDEAALLGLTRWFGEEIHGSSPGVEFSKKAVFERLLADGQIRGAHFVSFGDGPVEIRATVELGGHGIAVCSDEESNGSGILDERKRSLLLAAGARVAIADLRQGAKALEEISPA